MFGSRLCSESGRRLPSVGSEEEHDALIRLEEQVHWLRQQFLEAEQEWEQVGGPERLLEFGSKW